MVSTVSALRITRTSTGSHPTHLPPFAMYQAFPGSDYYGGSVAIGLSPRRRSRISCLSDVQDGCRCPFRILEVACCNPASSERVRNGDYQAIPLPAFILCWMSRKLLDVNHRVQALLFRVWILGFMQCSIHHTVRASTGIQLGGFAVSSLSEHAAFPSSFRLQVGPVAQGYHAQPFPSCSGINSSRKAAHVVPAVVQEGDPLIDGPLDEPEALLLGKFLGVGAGVAAEAEQADHLAGLAQRAQRDAAGVDRLAAEPLGLGRLGNRGRREPGGGGLEESTAIRTRAGHGRLSWVVRSQTLVIRGLRRWEPPTIRPTSSPGPSGQCDAKLLL